MNERIQQLKGKIWTEEYWTKPNTDKLLPAQLNRFAELIVRECIFAVEDAGGIDKYHYTGAIGKHFGVEEQVQDSKELHTCPYRREIHNDYESLCDCDEDQQHQCAMDI